jgi:hypothetical protein
MLNEACRIATREKIARWCRDGALGSRAGLRVSRIRDLDTGIIDTITEKSVPLDPADWAANALGNLNGPHWQDGEAHFDWGDSPIHDPRTNLLWHGGTLYRIQVNGDDLHSMRASAPTTKRAGRPLGGGYRESDEPIVEKMREGLASGRFKSANEAGMHFADEAKGKNTKPESKAKRLVDRLKASEKSGRD